MREVGPPELARAPAEALNRRNRRCQPKAPSRGRGTESGAARGHAGASAKRVRAFRKQMENG